MVAAYEKLGGARGGGGARKVHELEKKSGIYRLWLDGRVKRLVPARGIEWGVLSRASSRHFSNLHRDQRTRFRKKGGGGGKTLWVRLTPTY